jgi:hypothetical protein
MTPPLTVASSGTSGRADHGYGWRVDVRPRRGASYLAEDSDASFWRAVDLAEDFAHVRVGLRGKIGKLPNRGAPGRECRDQ